MFFEILFESLEFGVVSLSKLSQERAMERFQDATLDAVSCYCYFDVVGGWHLLIH